MRNTPTDEQRQSHSSQDGEGTGSSGQVLGRAAVVLQTAKRWLADGVGRVRSLFERDDPLPPVPANPDPPACPDVEGFPPREYPLVFPDRDSGIDNDPEVIGVQADDRIILSHPENRDARIVSDVWEDVEQ